MIKQWSWTAFSYWVVLLFITVIIIFSLKRPDVPLIPKKEKKPDFTFENVKISQLDQGKVKWVLYANDAEIDKDKGITRLKTVKGTLFNNLQKNLVFTSPTATLSSVNGVIRLAKTQATVYGSGMPVTMSCNAMVWNSKKHRLIGKGDIRIHTDTISITGRMFQADIPVTKIKIYNEATAIIRAI